MSEQATLMVAPGVRLRAADERNWQLETLGPVTNPRTKATAMKWRPAGYYGRTASGLAAAVRASLDVSLRTSVGAMDGERFADALAEFSAHLDGLEERWRAYDAEAAAEAAE